MIEISQSELADLINCVHKAVDQTEFGPMITYAGTPAEPKKIVSQVASAIFMETLRGVLAKMDKVRIVPDTLPSDIVTSLDP